jgi:hypothetical protein
MGFLGFGDDPPAPPQEDPEIAAMREREERRAEGDRRRQMQLGLVQATARRRGRGLQSLLRGFNPLSTKLGSG